MFKVASFMSGNNQEKFLLGLLATALLFFFFALFTGVCLDGKIGFDYSNKLNISDFVSDILYIHAQTFKYGEGQRRTSTFITNFR